MRQIFLGLLTLAFVAGGVATAGAQEASTSYKGARRDPFTKYKPPVKRQLVKKTAEPVAPPSIQSRIDKYKADKQAAMSRQQAAPKPTTALLLSELQVIGIFRTPRGFAAMVEATPIKLSYVIYPGEPFYDGMLVAIEETRLVFRRQTRWTDGRLEVAVESKPLRQQNVNDSMTVTRAATGEAPAPAPKAKDDRDSELERLKAEVERLKALTQSAGTQQQEAGRP
jgi:hypothetical protein